MRLIFLLSCMLAPVYCAEIRVLIVDGQNNHDWKATTPVLKQILESSGRFKVDVATTPPKGGDMSTFNPDFSKYDVVVSNYNGDNWPEPVQSAFEKFVAGGHGFVSYHAADNAFPAWKEYQKMTAVGGWGGRKTDKDGPMIRYRDGKVELDTTTVKNCGSHGARLAFQVTMRDPKHPIAKGLPLVWMHAADELYDSLCGPARDMTVVATAHSLKTNRGTDEEEPMLLAVRYGKGRVFHTTLGHDVPAMECVGFAATLVRGVEWTATGKVTAKVPADFPGPDQPSVHKH